MAISTPTEAVNPQADYPAFCILRSGDNTACVFPYEGALGDKFVADMQIAGWLAERVEDVLVLTAPVASNIIPFPKHYVRFSGS